MQFRVLTIHAQEGAWTDADREGGLAPYPVKSDDDCSLELYRPDLCPSLCPRISALSQTRTCCLLTHSQLCHLTGRGLTTQHSQLSFKLSWRLSSRSVCHCDKMRRMRRWRQTWASSYCLLPSVLEQVYPLKVLLRVQNMRRILKRGTFYNL